MARKIFFLKAVLFIALLCLVYVSLTFYNDDHLASQFSTKINTKSDVIGDEANSSQELPNATTQSIVRNFQTSSKPQTISQQDAGNLTSNITQRLLNSTQSQEQTCEAKKNIVFVKTHKTASTAVQNVLLRYGYHNELRFAFPQNTHDFAYPGWFHQRQVTRLETGPFNIMCHHMRFKHDRVADVMPKDSLYVTILREPGEQYESSFIYFYELVPSFHYVPQHSTDSMEKWLDNAEDYFRKTRRSTYSHLAKNPTFFDLGYDNMSGNEVYINQSIYELDKIFDLVLLSDYYAESMVLLSDLMCWDLENFACLKLNSRNQDMKSVSSAARARIREKARNWNKADAAIYDYFNATFWKKVEEYGREKMRSSLDRLNEINANVTALCIEGGKSVDFSEIKDKNFKKQIFKPSGVSVKSYNLKEGAGDIEICSELIESELHFSKRLIQWQQHQPKDAHM